LRAIWYERLGDAEGVLNFDDRKVPQPQPRKGEVLVKIFYSGVNPSDVKRRRGQTSSMKMEFPLIVPHNDGAGVIESVGEGVSEPRVGERVWIYEAQIRRPFGTGEEYVALPQELIVPLPDNTSFEMGASLGVPAMTAHHCIFADGPIREKNILVSGGAGAVGNFAIQFAKWGGAKRVIATVSSKEKGDIARKAGADEVINYKTEDIVPRIQEATDQEGIDRIVEVDLGGNLMKHIKVLKPLGIISSYASDAQPDPVFPFYSLFTRNPTFHFVLVYTMGKKAHEDAIRDITLCLRENMFVPNIGKIYPPEEIVAAHKAVEKGEVVGKVLVKF
jgi:NADPH2:quinone reductase